MDSPPVRIRSRLFSFVLCFAGAHDTEELKRVEG